MTTQPKPITREELAELKAQPCSACSGVGWRKHSDGLGLEKCWVCDGLGLDRQSAYNLCHRAPALIAAAERLHAVEAECERNLDDIRTHPARPAFDSGRALAHNDLLDLIRKGRDDG